VFGCNETRWIYFYYSSFHDKELCTNTTLVDFPKLCFGGGDDDEVMYTIIACLMSSMNSRRSDRIQAKPTEDNRQQSSKRNGWFCDVNPSGSCGKVTLSAQNQPWHAWLLASCLHLPCIWNTLKKYCDTKWRVSSLL
jgi:hypothetical protein